MAHQWTKAQEDAACKAVVDVLRNIANYFQQPVQYPPILSKEEDYQFDTLRDSSVSKET